MHQRHEEELEDHQGFVIFASFVIFVRNPHHP
jgi:hypothetical protein